MSTRFIIKIKPKNNDRNISDVSFMEDKRIKNQKNRKNNQKKTGMKQQWFI